MIKFDFISPRIFLYEQFYKNIIEAKIWSKFFTNNSRFGYENFPNEGLNQDKNFEIKFKVGSGENLKKSSK